MSDVIWVLIITWIVYQLYNSFKGSTYVYNKTENHHYHQTNEGKTTIDTNTNHKSKSNDNSEYVDYEEIK